MADITQLGFHFDSGKCSGCKACQIICKSKFDAEITQNNRRVYEYVGGTTIQNNDKTIKSNVFAYYVSIGCNHCSEPVCVKACPTGACNKQKGNGLVKIDPNICIGCGSCSRACPYDAPQLDPVRRIMTKCDGCEDEVRKGELPRCVAGCPQRALDFGTMNELKDKYPNATRGDIAPLPNPSITNPSLLVTQNKHARSSGSYDGKIENKSEV
ncbi:MULTISPECIES: DMSO/selenate family reductase complex B subunit [Shewanella]|uniref:Dimethylsulfoxide reductase subunit B n=1 Tax=Shewanella xiamenensis TaxID=332186 RepID=A0ABT6UG57_9GAMM|nr:MULTISPECIES: DMSO/selenate family reductase complex B subunit [Shewanella]MCH7425061.1 dimethylsulfoxide reductase subunit B [Shewanella sp. MM_2022_3]MDI5833454.1 dimethylsulfoxide reductase subunit B [Shewanella xiamenensis]